MSSTYLLFVSALLMGGSTSSVHAFGVAPPTSVQRLAFTSLSYSEHTFDKAHTPIEPGFEERMRAAVHKKRTINEKKFSGRPSHVHEVLTMEQFEQQVTCEKDQLVVVRFFAPWCRACKSVTPSYFKFSNDLEASGKKVKFVDCPMTAINTEVHKELGIKSIPFAHVYHPETGLAEERKMSRKNYSNFEKVVRSYLEGGCDLKAETEEETSYCADPWAVKYTSRGPAIA